MSFAYMPWFTGDYLRDTRHLTPEEHGCYLMLLAHCWDQKGPAPLDERKLCGIVNARSGGEVESLRRVLNEFFVRMDDGWYNKRMTEEVARSESISRKKREAGLKSASVRRSLIRNKLNEHVFNTCSTRGEHESVTPSPSPSQSPSPSEKKKTRTSTLGVAELVSLGVDRQHAEDWIRARTVKRLPLTRTALEGVQKEASKAGITLAEAIAKAAANGWGGFKATWSAEANGRAPIGRQAALEALNRQAIDEFVRDGEKHAST